MDWRQNCSVLPSVGVQDVLDDGVELGGGLDVACLVYIPCIKLNDVHGAIDLVDHIETDMVISGP